MNWLFLLPYYLMSITHALELAVGEGVMCFYDWTLCKLHTTFIYIYMDIYIFLY